MLSLYLPFASDLQTDPGKTILADDNPLRDDAALLRFSQQSFALPKTASMLHFPCLQNRRFNAEVLLQFSSINLLRLQRFVPSNKGNGRIKDVDVRDLKLTKLVGMRVLQALIPYLVFPHWLGSENTESLKIIR